MCHLLLLCEQYVITGERVQLIYSITFLIATGDQLASAAQTNFETTSKKEVRHLPFPFDEITKYKNTGMRWRRLCWKLGLCWKLAKASVVDPPIDYRTRRLWKYYQTSWLLFEFI